MATSTRYLVLHLSLNLRNGGTKIALRGFATKVEKYHMVTRRKTYNKYVLDSEVAASIANKLDVQGKLVVEAYPGPGVLTRELIRNGAKKVIGLEPSKNFLPSLNALQDEVGSDVFQVRFADFAKIDPHLLTKLCREPAILSKDLFSGCEPVDWQSDEIPVKFVGIEGGKSVDASAKVLLSLLSRLPNREGIFHMGRCQLSFFYTQDRLKRLLAKHRSRHYNRLSILLGIFCDINVIHKEPCSSFSPCSSNDSKKSLTLVSITPKKRVDINVPEYCQRFISNFIRLLMLKPTQILVTALDGISPGSSEIVEHLGLPTDMRTYDLTPDQFAMVVNEFFQNGDRSRLDIFYTMFDVV